jgi:hypothetical protein
MSVPFARMGNRQRNLAVFATVGAVVLVAACVASLHRDPYQREMRPVYDVIIAGEQGWAAEATKRLDAIVARSGDRHALAERLLRESDGSLAAEGMALAVRSRHPRARHLVQRHVGDRRWNWYLSNNGELARQLLLHLEGQPVETWVVALLERGAAS